MKIKNKVTEFKAKMATAKETRAEKKENRERLGRIQREEEKRILRLMRTLTPGSEEYRLVRVEYQQLSLVHRDDRVSADNLIGAVTSIGGLGMAIGYDDRHNLSKHAAGFVSDVKVSLYAAGNGS